MRSVFEACALIWVLLVIVSSSLSLSLSALSQKILRASGHKTRRTVSFRNGKSATGNTCNEVKTEIGKCHWSVWFSLVPCAKKFTAVKYDGVTNRKFSSSVVRATRAIRQYARIYKGSVRKIHSYKHCARQWNIHETNARLASHLSRFTATRAASALRAHSALRYKFSVIFRGVSIAHTTNYAHICIKLL